MSFFNTTLKRNSKLDLSRPDLLKLVSMLEGELQAREIVIAVLKSEQIKRLLNPIVVGSMIQPISGFKTTKQIDHCTPKNNNNQTELTAEQTIKYSSDPLIALSRDSLAIYEPSLEYPTTLALYNIKTFQLENLINNQRRLHAKTNDRLKLLENQYENMLNELEVERRKNGQYEKDFENYDRIKHETKIQELNQQLNETKDHMKQMIMTLLYERKQLILKLIDEKHHNEQLEQTLTTEKGKMAEMVEGLEDESKRSLQMEAELEKYLNDFDKERQEFHSQLQESEAKNVELIAENDRLRNMVESLQAQLQATTGKCIASKSLNSNIVDQEKWNLGEGVRSSIVTTTPVGPKVQSLSSVNPVFHPKASVAQPIPITAAANKTISPASILTTTATIAAKSIHTQDTNLNNSSNNTIILPPPSIPAPQPKQQPNHHCTMTNSCTKNKMSTTEAADNITIINNNNNNENDSKLSSSSKSLDTSVKQTVMFYENSAKTTSISTTTTTSTTTTSSSSSSSSISTTGTMVKKPTTGPRPTPPPIPPNKPSIKPVLPHQAILSSSSFNKTNINNNNNKDSNAITNNNNKINNSPQTTSSKTNNNKSNNGQQKQGTMTASILKKLSFDGKS
ncbi:uncharacterized protein LOC124493022 [Dermatophagoides farinae]|uniref:uncharacterized protein LOC124493022 n=1 Tax=Dermatophagoides farinae TaxID=6954 RepID=UPI003F63AFF6